MEDALTVVDRWLRLTPGRDMFTSAEVEDLLLDLRQLLTLEAALT